MKRATICVGLAWCLGQLLMARRAATPRSNSKPLALAGRTCAQSDAHGSYALAAYSYFGGAALAAPRERASVADLGLALNKPVGRK
jgi:hypothetical protein